MPGLSEKVFSTYKCGLRKDFNSFSYLIKPIEKWKAANDKSELFGVSISITIYQTIFSAFHTSFALPYLKVMDLVILP